MRLGSIHIVFGHSKYIIYWSFLVIYNIFFKYLFIFENQSSGFPFPYKETGNDLTLPLFPAKTIKVGELLISCTFRDLLSRKVFALLTVGKKEDQPIRMVLTSLGSSDMNTGIGVCCRCGEGFGTHQQIVNSNGEVWHPQCFVCAQCFQPFPEGIFYEFEGRKYCEHDFHVLFAPCCGKCGEFIVGRVIKALSNSWHPDCFRCELCTGPLADSGFVKNAGRALCRECNAKEKARGMGKYVCHKCHAIIEEGHIKYKGEAFHPYHFNCNSCSIELNSDAREVNGELYCLRCHDKMGIPICGACRRPIEERVVHALGKAWHVEHFVCAKCEKPFFGTRHYEKKGLAYCEIHYHQLFGNICFTCNSVISGDVFHAFNKAWHVNHFACSICERKMSQKTKFFEFDLKPVCKFCYDKFPGELKRRLKKAYEEQNKK